MNDPWRKVDEWIGRTPDSDPPPSVAERVCRRFKDICQGICKQAFAGRTAIMDHIIPLRDWTGAPPHGNRESNLQPICRLCHNVKTGFEAKVRAKVTRIRKKHLGIKKPSAWAERYAWAKRIKAERQKG